MKKSKYDDYREEIFAMQQAGMTSSEIAAELNRKKESLKATESGIRTYLSKNGDFDAEEKSQEFSDSNVEIPQKCSSPQLPEFELREQAALWGEVNKSFQHATEQLAQGQKQFFEATYRLLPLFDNLNDKIRRRQIGFLFASGWIISLFSTLITGYYIGRCSKLIGSRTTLYFIMSLGGIPAGFLFAIPVVYVFFKWRYKRKTKKTGES
jgi:hypothetical protein